jgi:hypothetical protein
MKWAFFFIGMFAGIHFFHNPAKPGYPDYWIFIMFWLGYMVRRAVDRCHVGVGGRQVEKRKVGDIIIWG